MLAEKVPPELMYPTWPDPDPVPIWRPVPRITIDSTKCTVPFDCKKCIQVCPQLVFNAGAAVRSEFGDPPPDPKMPGSYRLRAGIPFKCTNCGLCIKVCPVDAIKIEFPQE